MRKLLLLCLALPFFLAAQTEKGARPINSQQPTANGQTRAVVVGISDYKDPAIPDLRFAHRDAEAFANFLRSPAGGALDGDRLQVLTNHNATAGRIIAALTWLVTESKPGDKAIFAFSGHGDVEQVTKSQWGYLLAHDSPPEVYPAGGTVPVPYLQDIIATLSETGVQVFVVSDACHAGKLAGSTRGGSKATTSALAQQFSKEVKILSCQPDEYSIESEQWGGGRGCFSFHLLNALVGDADANSDGAVSLLETGRYLEDKVPADAAPQSQIPMTVGSRATVLASVDAPALAAFRAANKQLPALTLTSMKGMEDALLAGTDSTLREIYHQFVTALESGHLLDSSGHSANDFYLRLIGEPQLAKLHGAMTRNLAAALQDEAQQAINIFLKADAMQLECMGQLLTLGSIPRQLERAAALLGEGHYMQPLLLARKMLFEGMMLEPYNNNPNERLARQRLALYREALTLEPQSPLAWFQMSMAYLTNLRLIDSAFVCAKEARELAPNWVLPYARLGLHLTNFGKLDQAKLALQEAEAIDSLSPHVLTGWAGWYGKHIDRSNKEKALVMFEKYRETGGVLFPCWHNNYAIALQELGKYEEAETELFESIALDSAYSVPWNNLGLLYINTDRIAEAELVWKKSILLDSTSVDALNNLGNLYVGTARYAEAEPLLNKAVTLDSTVATAWNGLAIIYRYTDRYAEVEPALKKAIALDSTHVMILNSLGVWYNLTSRFEEAESVLKKVIAIDSTYAVAWSSLGWCYYSIRRYAEAEPVLNKAIALDSALPHPRKQLGMVYFNTNRPEEARLNFLKAMELNPNYAAAMLGMAYLLAAEGKTADALGYVEQAIGKGSTFEQLEKDEDLASLRALPEWKALMKKYFPDKVKD